MKTSWIISRRKNGVTKFVPDTTFGNDNSWPKADLRERPLPTQSRRLTFTMRAAWAAYSLRGSGAAGGMLGTS